MNTRAPNEFHWEAEPLAKPDRWTAGRQRDRPAARAPSQQPQHGAGGAKVAGSGSSGKNHRRKRNDEVAHVDHLNLPEQM